MDNVVTFVQVLRAAGITAGTGAALDAIRAVGAVGLQRRDDVFWALRTTLIDRPDQIPVFNRLFEIFWDTTGDLTRQDAAPDTPAAPKDKASGTAPQIAGARKAYNKERASRNASRDEAPGIMAFSRTDVLRTRDFERMDAAEQTAVRDCIARLSLTPGIRATRRMKPGHGSGRIDMRASVRNCHIPARALTPNYKKPGQRVLPLVVLCDISGSMSVYSRMFLLFMHALTHNHPPWEPNTLHGFVFGTRLTNISRPLRRRRPDEALAHIAGAVRDWDGGTRIGEALWRFNRDWSRRLPLSGATVLLMTDGLERGDTPILETAMVKLHRACARLIWLNPLLRYERFEPRAEGIRTMLRHVDDFLPVHNLQALYDVTAILENVRPHDRHETLAG